MVYEGRINCPYCDHKGSDFKFLKEWTSNNAIVNRLECPSCKKIFRLYFGERNDGGPFAYTIKVK